MWVVILTIQFYTAIISPLHPLGMTAIKQLGRGLGSAVPPITLFLDSTLFLQVHVGRNEAVAGQSRIIDTTMAYPWVNLRKPLQLSPALLLNAVFTIFMWLHL